MNRGILESSPSGGHQIMGGVNPNWWNINSMRPPMVYQQTSSPNFLPFNPPPPQLFPQFLQDHHHELPESWSQLLLGEAIGEDQAKRFGTNWDDSQVFHHLPNASIADSIKEENNTASSYMYGQGDEDFQATEQPAAWPHQQVISTSSPPSSCVTSFGNNMLDFINNKSESRHPRPDRSSECNSTANAGGAVKKARIQTCSAQSTFKVRKEKLGDRITALHQLVSPFGKTDTASVLLEAIGYIRFLQSQIEALSLPYLGNASTGKMRHQQQQQQQQQQHPGQGDQRICIFPEDPGQKQKEKSGSKIWDHQHFSLHARPFQELLHDNYMKNKGSTYQETPHHEEPKMDLRSRGLCLVPVSCTLQVGNDNGADYWAPPPDFGGGFR